MKKEILLDNLCRLRSDIRICGISIRDKQTDDNYIKALDEVIEIIEKEPCEDAISRDAAIDLIADYELSMDEVVRGIHALPPVTSQPKTGHWEQYGYPWEDKFKCSECGKEQPKILCGEKIIGHWSDYCPYCGAELRGAK